MKTCRESTAASYSEENGPGSLHRFKRNQPSWHFDLRVPASRAMRMVPVPVMQSAIFLCSPSTQLQWSRKHSFIRWTFLSLMTIIAVFLFTTHHWSCSPRDSPIPKCRAQEKSQVQAWVPKFKCDWLCYLNGLICKIKIWKAYGQLLLLLWGLIWGRTSQQGAHLFSAVQDPNPESCGTHLWAGSFTLLTQ